MSTTPKKTSMKGVRYSAAQKQEVVDFVIAYNAANGRGGLSKASEKFKVSQISISTWLKSAGAASPKAAKKAAKVKTPKAPKAKKAAKAPKAAKAGKGKRRSRYSDEQKKELIDFVVAYNEANGRGGANNASKKFKISPLTVITWLKAAGVKPPGKKVVKVAGAKVVKKAGKKAAKKAGRKAKAAPTTAAAAAPVAASGNMGIKLNALAVLHSQIEKAEAALAADKAKFAALKAAL